MSLPTKVYQRESNNTFFKLVSASLKDMISSHFLAKQLATRDIKAQYRQSYLGILWAFISPVTTAVVWVILNKSGTLNIADTGMPYPVYAFSGTLLWSILVESINAPKANTTGARGILSKINFPKEALIISGIYKLLFNSMVKIILLFVLLLLFDVGFYASILWLPLLLLCGIFFGTTIGLFITPFGMLYKDVGQIISFGLRFLMYATPVVYTVPNSGIFRDMMLINPLTPLITTTREAIVGMPYTQLYYFIGILLVCIPLFLIGLVFYRISIPIIVERTS